MENIRKFALTGLVAFITACSHFRPAPDSQRSGELADSEVSISYGLGHTHRKVQFQAKDQKIVGQNFFDRQILRESTIEPMRYTEFLQRASEFINKTQRNPAADISACRNPFTLTVRVEKESKTLKGCRSSDEGVLGRLIRDGEFLLLANHSGHEAKPKK